MVKDCVFQSLIEDNARDFLDDIGVDTVKFQSLIEDNARI